MSEREEIARIVRDFLRPGWGVRESDYLLADRIMPVIEAVRQEEREKAARIAEDTRYGSADREDVPDLIAARIRGRSGENDEAG